MDIRNFITFNAVVQHGSFTKAAKELNYAQSTVTLHIKELESHYTSALFDRIGKKIYLTDLGHQVHEKSKRLEADYTGLLAINDQSHSKATLRIGGFESILKYRLYDIINIYTSRHPEVNLVIHYDVCTALREMIQEGSLDLAFQLDARESYPNLITRPLIQESLCLLLPPHSNLEDIYGKIQKVFLTEEDCNYRSIFVDFMNENAIIPQSITTTSSVDLIKQYVSYSQGFSMLPEVTLRNENEKKRMTVIPFDNPTPLYSQLVYHKDKQVFPAMKSFIDLVVEMAEKWE